jgi:hypothetical protein
LSNAIVIHVLRPYANEEEYLASERFSIDSKSMLLIDQPPLPLETAIIFDIQLENGQKPIRAEAKVIGHVAASADSPGGLRVRFKRFGAATKAFIDRARSQPGAAPSAQLAEPVSIRPAPSLVPPSAATLPELRETAATLNPLSNAAARSSDRRESSGIHRRPVVPVPAPVNREELLERLRARARNAVQVSASKPNEQTG